MSINDIDKKRKRSFFDSIILSDGTISTNFNRRELVKKAAMFNPNAQRVKVPMPEFPAYSPFLRRIHQYDETSTARITLGYKSYAPQP